MTKEKFIQSFKSSPYLSVIRNVREETFLIMAGYTREKIEEHWENSANELAEKAWEEFIKKQVEISCNDYFSMPDKVFNSGTGCQDNIIK